MKRQATARGTPNETTKSSLKFEHDPDGAMALLRFEVSFPDGKTDFSGSAFDPRLGDIKIRVGRRALQVDKTPSSPYIEVSLPTANPRSLGSGKYQVNPGIQTSVPQFAAGGHLGPNKPFLTALVEQDFSVAGDASRGTSTTRSSSWE